MDLVTRESEKLALLQANILLLPNSLSFKEFPAPGSDPIASLRATHRLELSLKYALVEAKVLVTLSKPLDFLILTPKLFPADVMNGLVKIDENTRLVELVEMLVQALQEHQTNLLGNTVLDHLPGKITNLAEINPTMSHELMVLDDHVTIVLCFKPEEEISICSVNNLVKSSKLVNTADHCYSIKLEFIGEKFKSEDFGVLWSLDLTAMFPELADVRLPSMKPDDDFVEFVTTSKEGLERHLQTAYDAWEERSKVMLKIVYLLADLDGVAVNLDSDTMTGLDIVFRTATKSHVYTVTLHTGTERGDGMIECFAQKEDDKRDENQAWKLTAKELDNVDKILLNLIRKDIDGNSGKCD